MTMKKPPYNQIFKSRENSKEMAKFANLRWDIVVTELGEFEEIPESKLKTIDRYVREICEYDALYPIAMAEGPTIKSGNGGEYANMKWVAIGKSNERIMKLEAVLFLWAKSGRKEELPVKNKPVAWTPADEFLNN